MARATLTDPVATSARRILLIGVTGSGKTTLARRIEARHGIPAIDVDAMAWRPGWIKAPGEELAASAAAIAASDAWVMDSAWTAIRAVVLPAPSSSSASTSRGRSVSAACFAARLVVS